MAVLHRQYGRLTSIMCSDGGRPPPVRLWTYAASLAWTERRALHFAKVLPAP